MRKSLLLLIVMGVAIAIVITAIVLSGVIEQEEDLVLSNYPKLFEKDVVIVIGENATQMEYESAEAIAENLHNITGNMPVIKSDIELTEGDKAKYNLILVGSPNSNTVLKEVYEITDATRITEEYLGEKEILINPWNPEKHVLIATRCGAIPSRDEAIKIANKHLRHEKQQWEQYPEYFFPPNSYLGDPILIHDTSGREIFWVLPVCREDKILGSLTIKNRIEELVGVSIITRFDDPLHSYPEISAQEAKIVIHDIANEKYDNILSISDPTYVYSRWGETWMSTISSDSEISKLFLIANSKYKYVVWEQTEEGVKRILESSRIGGTL